MRTVHVEFIGDFICPWCYLGKVRLERVKALIKDEIQLEIVVKPYILYPSIPKGGAPKANFRKTKPGMGKALRQAAKTENIQFNYQLIDRIPSSLEAHRLIWLIQNNNQAYQLSKNIFHDYFEKGQDIESYDYLAEQAATVGVQNDIIQRFLTTNAGELEVNDYVAACKDQFITVVPFLKLNKNVPLPGLQTVEIWENYIRRASRMI